MARLPNVGGDTGNWGSILNEYLSVSLNSDGTIKDTSLDSAGAVLNSDTATTDMQFVVDEDDLSSDSDTLVPTQQSVKAYVDTADALLIPKDFTSLTAAPSVVASDILPLVTDVGGGDDSEKATVAQVLAAPDTVNTVATTGATEEIDWNTVVHDLTMDQDCVFSFANNANGGSITVLVTGAFTPTWPGTVLWDSGTEPTYASPSIYTFVQIGGNIVGAVGGTALATA